LGYLSEEKLREKSKAQNDRQEGYVKKFRHPLDKKSPLL